MQFVAQAGGFKVQASAGGFSVSGSTTLNGMASIQSVLKAPMGQVGMISGAVASYGGGKLGPLSFGGGLSGLSGIVGSLPGLSSITGALSSVQGAMSSLSGLSGLTNLSSLTSLTSLASISSLASLSGAGGLMGAVGQLQSAASSLTSTALGQINQLTSAAGISQLGSQLGISDLGSDLNQLKSLNPSQLVSSGLGELSNALGVDPNIDINQLANLNSLGNLGNLNIPGVSSMSDLIGASQDVLDQIGVGSLSNILSANSGVNVTALLGTGLGAPDLSGALSILNNPSQLSTLDTVLAQAAQTGQLDNVTSLCSQIQSSGNVDALNDVISQINASGGASIFDSSVSSNVQIDGYDVLTRGTTPNATFTVLLEGDVVGNGSVLWDYSSNNYTLVVNTIATGLNANAAVLSFNNRTGNITLINTDVTNALGFVPLSVSGTAYNSLYFGSQLPSFYSNAANLTGTLPTSVLLGTYNINISGNSVYATTAGYTANAGYANTANSSLWALDANSANYAGQLNIPRWINVAGAVTGNVQFSGASDVTITTTIGPNVTANNANYFAGQPPSYYANATYLNSQPSTYYLNASNLNAGTVAAARMPAFTGDATAPVGTATLTLATVNPNVGTWGNATQVGQFTVNGKGLITSAANVTITPAWSSITSVPSAVSSLAGLTGAGVITATATGSLAMVAIGNTSATIPNIAAADTRYLQLGGGTMTGALYLASDPSSPTMAATKNYVDNSVQGLSAKPSVQVAANSNQALSGTVTIDGVAVAVGARVLCMGQTTSSQNGIYIVASGAWARSSDMNAWTEVSGSFVFVEQGTQYGGTGWICTSAPGGTLGTTAITFVQFSQAGTYTGTNGVTVNGTSIQLTGQVLTLNNYNSTGLMAYTGSGTFTGLSLVAPAAGLTITNPNGVGGNPTFALAGELAAVQGLSTTGYTKRTGTATWVAQAIPDSDLPATLTGHTLAGTTTLSGTLSNIGGTGYQIGGGVSGGLYFDSQNIAIRANTNASASAGVYIQNYAGTSNWGLFQATGTTLGTNTTISGTLSVNDPSTNDASSLTINAASSASGANIKLIGNGATTPNKYIRAQAGDFQIFNSAYSAAIWQLDDSGNQTNYGNLTVNGAMTFNGAMTANTITTTGTATFGSSVNFFGDTNFYLTENGGNPLMNFNPNMFITGNRSANSIVVNVSSGNYVTFTNAGAVISTNKVQALGMGNIGQFEMPNGSSSTWYNAAWRNDGTNIYLLSSVANTTQAGAQTASWNTFRPFQYNLANGAVSINADGLTTLTLGGPTTHTAAWNASQGQIYLNDTTANGNYIQWADVGVAAPSFTTRSLGTKLVLWSNMSSTSADYAFGISSSTLWSSVPTTGSQFQWYGGTTVAATLSGAGALTLAGNLAVNGGTVTASTFSGTANNANYLAGYGIGSFVLNNSGTYSINITGSANYLGGTYYTSYVQNNGGTYSINITGNAGYATNAGYASSAGAVNGLVTTAGITFASGVSMYQDAGTGDYVREMSTSGDYWFVWKDNGTYTTSDARLKTNAVKLENAKDIVKSIGAYRFTWVKDGRSDIGFLAQEVQQLYPEVVMSRKTSKYDFDVFHVDYARMVPVLFEATKETMDEVDTLKSEIDELKALLNTAVTRITELEKRLST
jgi:hypothetical protein